MNFFQANSATETNNLIFPFIKCSNETQFKVTGDLKLFCSLRVPLYWKEET